MTMIWSTTTPSDNAPSWTFSDVLLEHDEPLVALFLDATGQHWIGVAVDEITETHTTRWLLVEIDGSQLHDIRRGRAPLRDPFLTSPQWVVDIRGDVFVSAWQTSRDQVPPAATPDLAVLLDLEDAQVEELLERLARLGERLRSKDEASIALVLDEHFNINDLRSAIEATSPAAIMIWLDELERNTLQWFAGDPASQMAANLAGLRAVQERERWQCIREAIADLARRRRWTIPGAIRKLDELLNAIDQRAHGLVKMLVPINAYRRDAIRRISTKPHEWWWSRTECPDTCEDCTSERKLLEFVERHIEPTLRHPTDVIESVAFGTATDAETAVARAHIVDCESCASLFDGLQFAHSLDSPTKDVQVEKDIVFFPFGTSEATCTSLAGAKTHEDWRAWLGHASDCGACLMGFAASPLDVEAKLGFRPATTGTRASPQWIYTRAQIVASVAKETGAAGDPFCNADNALAVRLVRIAEEFLHRDPQNGALLFLARYAAAFRRRSRPNYRPWAYAGLPLVARWGEGQLVYRFINSAIAEHGGLERFSESFGVSLGRVLDFVAPETGTTDEVGRRRCVLAALASINGLSAHLDHIVGVLASGTPTELRTPPDLLEASRQLTPFFDDVLRRVDQRSSEGKITVAVLRLCRDEAKRQGAPRREDDRRYTAFRVHEPRHHAGLNKTTPLMRLGSQLAAEPDNLVTGKEVAILLRPNSHVEDAASAIGPALMCFCAALAAGTPRIARGAAIAASAFLQLDGARNSALGREVLRTIVATASAPIEMTKVILDIALSTRDAALGEIGISLARRSGQKAKTVASRIALSVLDQPRTAHDLLSSIPTKDAHTEYWLGIAEQRLGRLGAANIHFRRARELGSPYAAYQEAKNALQRGVKERKRGLSLLASLAGTDTRSMFLYAAQKKDPGERITLWARAARVAAARSDEIGVGRAASLLAAATLTRGTCEAAKNEIATLLGDRSLGLISVRVLNALTSILPLYSEPVAFEEIVLPYTDSQELPVARAAWRYHAARAWRHALEGNGSSPPWWTDVRRALDRSWYRNGAIKTLVASPKAVPGAWLRRQLRGRESETERLIQIASRWPARSDLADHVVEGGSDSRTYYDEAFALATVELKRHDRELWGIVLEVATAVAGRFAADAVSEPNGDWKNVAATLIATVGTPEPESTEVTDGTVAGQMFTAIAATRRIQVEIKDDVASKCIAMAPAWVDVVGDVAMRVPGLQRVVANGIGDERFHLQLQFKPREYSKSVMAGMQRLLPVCVQLEDGDTPSLVFASTDPG